MRPISCCSLLLAAWLCAPTDAHALDALCQEPVQPAAAPGSVVDVEVPLAPVALPLGPSSESDVPWCTSADDPRCAPLDAPHPVTQVSTSGPLHTPQSATVAPPLLLTRPKGRVLGRSEVRPGHGRRIERPPQPNRCG
jgi:hypothetical protein